MKFAVTVGETTEMVEVSGEAGRYRLTIGSEVWEVDGRLTAQGIRPRKARHGRWAPSSIGEILRDSLYKGEAYYNRTQPAELHQPYGPRGRKAENDPAARGGRERVEIMRVLERDGDDHDDREGGNDPT